MRDQLGDRIQKRKQSLNRPAQLRKLHVPNYQYKFPAGRKGLFYFDAGIEQQLLSRGRAFAAFSTIEKALAGGKKSFHGPHAARMLCRPGSKDARRGEEGSNCRCALFCQQAILPQVVDSGAT